MLNKKTKYKDVKTSELLDFTSKEIPYEKDKERDKQQDYKDELENRHPFNQLKGEIERQNEEIKDIKKVLSALVKHKHDNEGNVVIPIRVLEEYMRRLML